MWTLLHGLTALITAGQLDTTPGIDVLVDREINTLLDGLRPRA